MWRNLKDRKPAKVAATPAGSEAGRGSKAGLRLRRAACVRPGGSGHGPFSSLKSHAQGRHCHCYFDSPKGAEPRWSFTDRKRRRYRASTPTKAREQGPQVLLGTWGVFSAPPSHGGIFNSMHCRTRRKRGQQERIPTRLSLHQSSKQI